MKLFSFTASVLLVIAAGPAFGQSADPHAQKVADIRKLLDLMGGSKQVEQMLTAVAATMKDPKQQAEYAEFAKDVNLVNQLYDLVIPGLDKYFSADEIREMIRFYESPLGRKMVEIPPRIMAEAYPQMMQLIQERMQQRMEKMREKAQQ